MGLSKTIWSKPTELLRAQEPENPVLFFAPAILQATAKRFLAGFPGLVTYAVKSNPDEMVIQNLDAAGIRGYDVASVYEIELIRRVAPGAAMHYHNPVRSRSEIKRAVELGIVSWSVDSRTELAKITDHAPVEGTEISVRFKLPVDGAAYNFGAKFGATQELAGELLAEVAQAGYTASLTFHPGTQCTDAMAWDAYIRAAAEIAAAAGVKIARLNVGGGFPSHRLEEFTPSLEPIFELIDRVTGEAFGDERPALVCEPGRGMVAEAFSLATRVRSVRDAGHIFLNDGVYGGLAELPIIGIIDRVEVVDTDGTPRTGVSRSRIVFGPTCDSVDRLPGELRLPGDIGEGDYVIFHGMGAYSTVTNTRFNGFGEMEIATAMSLRD